MDERQERIGRNEALHRTINDRLEELNEAFKTMTDRFSLVCECGDATCTEQMTVSIGEYERVRSDPNLFFVRPGHVASDVEEVVEAHGEYEVIRKHPGEWAKLARNLDERSR